VNSGIILAQSGEIIVWKKSVNSDGIWQHLVAFITEFGQL
jgi:hypothetical protein